MGANKSLLRGLQSSEHRSTATVNPVRESCTWGCPVASPPTSGAVITLFASFRFNMRSSWYLLLLVAACGVHDKPIGGICTSAGWLEQADCQDGLTCTTNDSCYDRDCSGIAGICRKLCTVDDQCPAGWACTSCCVVMSNYCGDPR